MADAIRFKKETLLKLLDRRAERIAKEQGFDRSRGTAQFQDRSFYAAIESAVQYGRMRAMEEIAESICEGFRFDMLDIDHDN